MSYGEGLCSGGITSGGCRIIWGGDFFRWGMGSIVGLSTFCAPSRFLSPI